MLLVTQCIAAPMSIYWYQLVARGTTAHLTSFTVVTSVTIDMMTFITGVPRQ
jgi:hypothetical protein